MDQQVKIRGYRVELSEIESVLLEVGAPFGVEQAVVDVREERLVGFVVLGGSEATEKSSSRDAKEIEIVQHIKEESALLLASYMVPAVIHVIAEIPQLTSGKAVRSSLKEPETETPARAVLVLAADEHNQSTVTTGSNAGLDLPTDNLTPEQRIVKDVFEEQLGAGTVTSVDDSFFALGGHSLLVSRAVTQLRKHCGSISARDFYSLEGR